MNILITDAQYEYLQKVLLILKSKGRDNSRMYEAIKDAIYYRYYYEKDSSWFNTSVRDYYLKNKI